MVQVIVLVSLVSGAKKCKGWARGVQFVTETAVVYLFFLSVGM